MGDMLELGKHEIQYHQDIANLDSIKCFYKIHCVGDLISHFYYKLPKSRRGLLVKRPQDLINSLLNSVEDRDAYVIKGSNSIGLSFLVEQLQKQAIQNS